MSAKIASLRTVKHSRGGLVLPSTVTVAVRRIVRRFRPQKVILFGSYAYGTPNRDSDVDLLVVMPARNETDQAVAIRKVIDPSFALDIIVRTPRNLAWRLQEGDWFLREIMSRGIVLYEKADARMAGKSRGRLGRGNKAQQGQTNLK